jgi:AraC-like DNA-binding protein
MIYREFAPPEPRLAASVARIWTLEGRAADLAVPLQPVLPDGCPELVLHLADPFERVDADGRSVVQPSIIFAGQLTRQMSLRPTGRVAVVGVRFHPDGASALLRHAQSELAGETVAASQLSPALARMFASIRSSTDDPAQAALLVQSELARVVEPASIDARVRHAVALIRRAHGLTPIDSVAAAVSMTRRHLERRFLEAVGVSPKRLSRITRFQRALRVLERVDADRPGTDTAARCGYADQSHFIREFKELAGCSPSTHLLSRGELTGFFSTGQPR